jgi:hypothetical protein
VKLFSHPTVRQTSKNSFSFFLFFIPLIHLEWIQQACHNVFSSPIQQSKRRYQDEHKEEKGNTNYHISCPPESDITTMEE